MRVVLRIVFGLAAVALLCAAFGQNALYWYRTLAADPLAAWLLVAFSLIAGAVKVASALFLEMNGWRRNPRLVGVFLAVLVFDLWSGLAYTNMTRTEAADTAAIPAGARRNLKATGDALRQERDNLPATRSVDLLKDLLENAPAPVCKTAADRLSDACKSFARVKEELSNARERARLTKAIEDNANVLDAKLVQDRPSAGAAMAKGLKTWGYEVAAETLDNVWSVLMLLVIEVAPLALIAYAATGGPASSEPSAHAGSPRVAKPRPAPGAVSVLDLLRGEAPAASGWIEGLSQQAMADRLRVSKTEVNREVARLVAAGAVAIDKGRRPAALKIV